MKKTTKIMVPMKIKPELDSSVQNIQKGDKSKKSQADFNLLKLGTHKR